MRLDLIGRKLREAQRPVLLFVRLILIHCFKFIFLLAELSLSLKLLIPLDVQGAVETGQSLVSLAVPLLSEAFAAFATLKGSVVPVSAEMVHHVTDLRKVGLADAADEDLVQALSLLVVDSSARVVELLRFVTLLVIHTSVAVCRHLKALLKASGKVIRLGVGNCLLKQGVRA